MRKSFTVEEVKKALGIEGSMIAINGVGFPEMGADFTFDIRSTLKPKEVFEPDRVLVYRYVRLPGGKNNSIDNMNGATVLFEIDYRSRRVRGAFSICSNDNFDKATGRSIAAERFDTPNGPYKFEIAAYPIGGSERGLLDLLATAILNTYQISPSSVDAHKRKLYSMIVNRV